MQNFIRDIQENIKDDRELLVSHPLYDHINDIQDLKKFTEGHIFAVWDFMSLLKALQINLTCTTIPWLPGKNPETRYFINEIVLAEESDLSNDGKHLSHYELYLRAMEDIGSDINKIKDFIFRLQKGDNLQEAICELIVDQRIKEFLNFTFNCIEGGKAHIIASVFTFGREDLIPGMFTSILKNIQSKFPEADLENLIYYFQRHIDLDGDEHGPLALRMIEEITGDDPDKWQEVKIAAKEALAKRLGMWDAIFESL